MIIEAIFNVFFNFIEFLIEILPFSIESTSGGLNSFFDLLSYGVYIIGPTCFVAIIGTWITWTGIHITWAIIEWIYKKIPGVS